MIVGLSLKKRLKQFTLVNSIKIFTKLYWENFFQKTEFVIRFSYTMRVKKEPYNTEYVGGEGRVG